MPIISITIPDELMRQFEKFIKDRGYYSRSEAFRDAIRNIISQKEDYIPPSSVIAATIMAITNIENKDVDMKLTEYRDEYDDVVVENIHRHIGKDYCLEIFIAQGSRDRVLEFLARVRGLRKLKHVDAVFLPIYY